MGITNKQKIFIEEYLKSWNATDAAKRAGYSERSAGEIGCENLQKKYIKREIEKRLLKIKANPETIKERIETNRNNKKSDYVYLIQDETHKYIKIGMSNNPNKRLASLQTGCPQKLLLLAVLKTNKAKDIELNLHSRFKDKRYNAEWFILSNEDIKMIIKEWDNGH